MNKKRIMYIGILLIVTVIVTITSFSYAFLTRVDEEHGKLNMIVGELNYKIESNDLTNNSITLSAGEATEIEIIIKAENEINTKYELYTNNVENVEIGYLDEEGFEEPTGTIGKTGTKKVKIVLENTSNASKTITFGVQGGFDYNEVALKSGRVEIEEGEALCTPGIAYEFDYTGDVQEFTARCPGVYKLEVWGAQGGARDATAINTGYGGYSTGTLNLNENSTIYVVVGGKGGNQENVNATSLGGYNGGGIGGMGTHSAYQNIYVGGGGGGATHIAYVTGILSSIGYNQFVTNQQGIIVAGGGGGAGGYDDIVGGAGGGIVGGSGTNTQAHPTYHATGGTQTTGGLDQSGENTVVAGTFGKGSDFNGVYGGTGGGGGLYGGGGTNRNHSGAGGGSGYIGNSNLINKKMVCYNCQTSTNVNTYTESNTCASDIPTSDCSKIGNGYARITYFEKPTELSSKVLSNNSVITANSTNLHLNNTSTYYNENGLYEYTYDNKTTYFFRGNVTNNYVRFAGNTWRIVRINEDGTIRLIMQDGINNNQIVAYNPSKSSIYYSESNAKTILDNWYNTNLSDYSDYIKTGNYYCEQFKVAYSTAYATNVGMPETTTYTNYVPNFICGSDKNGKGIVTSNIGLITYDELAFAGAYYGIANNAFYLYNGSITWSMSSDGGTTSEKQVWGLDTAGNIGMSGVSSIIRALRPVINLNSSVKVSGSGTLIDPYVVY